MNVIVVDDELAPLLTFSSHILDNAEITANMFSSQIDKALEFAKNNLCKAVFLDIVMPSINGVDLAKKFIEINPEIKVVFITGYAQNEDKIKAELGNNFFAFCYKPYDERMLNGILQKLLNDSAPSVYFNTFSHFDCYVNKTVVDFARAKSKELLALLVDKRGATLTMEEAITCLWGEKPLDLSKKLPQNSNVKEGSSWKKQSLCSKRLPVRVKPSVALPRVRNSVDCLTRAHLWKRVCSSDGMPA